MSTATQAPPPPVTRRKPWLSSLPNGYRIALRWLFIAAVTVVAFHRSLLSIIDTTRAGGLNGYIWMVSVAGILAAAGVAVRRRTELPIHDRQTDIIVAIMGLVLAFLLHAVLLGRYSLYFDLLRLDLVAAWTFVLSSCIALFGLRPVIRFGWVWVLLLAVFPLPYHLFVQMLGGTHVAAGMGTLLIAAAATAVAVGRQRGRGLLGALAAWGVGLAVLAVMAVAFRGASVLAFQMIPALMSIGTVGLAMLVIVHRRGNRPLFGRQLEPLSAGQVWAALPVVLIMGIALSFVRLPNADFEPDVRIDRLRFDTPLSAPPGWHSMGIQVYPWVSRFYGEGAELVRQRMVADVGDARFDKLLRPREVVVDATTTRRPYGFRLFPPILLYRVGSIRLSTAQLVDLGFGVTGRLLTAVDDNLLVTWDSVEWSWGNGHVEQRVSVISVDNHDDNAPFPQPTGGMSRTLNSLFTVLFRGNAATSDSNSTVKDAVLLTELGRAMVRARLEPLGIKP